MSESTSIKLTDGLKERIHMLAKSKRRSANWIMNDAIDKYVEREEIRVALLRELREAHAEYELDGRMHLTQEEVEQWMKQRRTDRHAPMPPLHR